MERVRKTFFDPLATSKVRIRELLQGLPVGSAHPFSPEHILLCRTENGIEEIDISQYPQDYFFTAVDLGEMGEVLLERMAGFSSQLRIFQDFQILQAPAATFKVPIDQKQISILAVSKRYPTYYDFCLASESGVTSCYGARNTLSGIAHSGDCNNGENLLQYVKLDKNHLNQGKPICTFISGYRKTPITKFLGTNPALMVANHADKVLYLIPVPLDAATIGDATICCPMVVKRDGDSLICSILPAATKDSGKDCTSGSLESGCFKEAIMRANFTIDTQAAAETTAIDAATNQENENVRSVIKSDWAYKDHVVFAANNVTLPPELYKDQTQIVRFGTGLDFGNQGVDASLVRGDDSTVILPCIFGSKLQGPVLLATGTVPLSVPFTDEQSLQAYYSTLKSVVAIVDDSMTDNARNLAGPHRVNGLFIVRLKPQKAPKNAEEVVTLLNTTNINAVTALAGPQSLVLVQVFHKYYFYRGLANRTHLITSGLEFGADITSILQSVGMKDIVDPRVPRLVNLDDTSTIFLPKSSERVEPHHLQRMLEKLPVEQIQNLEEDIYAAVPQLQVLLGEKEVQQLSIALVATLTKKMSDATEPLRNSYVACVKEAYQKSDPELLRKKERMLGDLRKQTRALRDLLEPIISSLSSMMSSQATSKRTHDIKRLARQAAIQSNVDAAKSMTFETLAGLLETHAEEMGVMLLNIKTEPYTQLLGRLDATSDVSASCELDSRILHLGGLDAGIIIEQSQGQHNGPLTSQSGPQHPILAVPYLGQGELVESMLAWVCWDEFVNLENPFKIRWMEKCNETHIATFRIVMRDTLSRAVASRQYDFNPASHETGHLMSALLMSAMAKLAAMRSTVPDESSQAEDTVTKLMRGLFGNLLTTAGSGVRPLSMVWQLLGKDATYDLPTKMEEWIWYRTVVSLYPYTGWSREQFYNNLAELLDKAIVRTVTRNEDIKKVRSSRIEDMVKYCKLRNIVLEHSRSIVTVFMKMFTTDGVDLVAVAGRLLGQIPRTVKKQTDSYERMIEYLEHLQKGGERRPDFDFTSAAVYTRRSGVFGSLKTEVSDACKAEDWDKVKELCHALMKEITAIAILWKIEPQELRVQNIAVYKELLAADFGDDIDQATKTKNGDLIKKVHGDAENNRIPWQVGKEGEFGGPIEPLDEAFVHEMMTGLQLEKQPVIDWKQTLSTGTTVMAPVVVSSAAILADEDGQVDEFKKYESTLRPQFIAKMQNDLTAEKVCQLIDIPEDTMQVFVDALNPNFAWQRLAPNFKRVILGLLENRSNRMESQPVRKLLEMDHQQGQLMM